MWVSLKSSEETGGTTWRSELVFVKKQVILPNQRCIALSMDDLSKRSSGWRSVNTCRAFPSEARATCTAVSSAEQALNWAASCTQVGLWRLLPVHTSHCFWLPRGGAGGGESALRVCCSFRPGSTGAACKASMLSVWNGHPRLYLIFLIYLSFMSEKRAEFLRLWSRCFGDTFVSWTT